MVSVNADTLVELDENFTVALSAPSDRTVIGTSATSTILNDDAALTIANASVYEGNSGVTPLTFTVTRTGYLSQASTANWNVVPTTTDNTIDTADFSGYVSSTGVARLPSGSLSFAAGEASKTITVNIAGNSTFEPDENFLLQLSSPSVGTAIANTATGTILNDDAGVGFSGDSGPNTIVGTSGPDLIDGMLGNDTLTGGAGSDVFRFDTVLYPQPNIDTIVDFALGDKIQLENSVFSQLSVTGPLASNFFASSSSQNSLDTNSSNAYILYNSATGGLFYDSNGNVSGGAIQFAILQNLPNNSTFNASSFEVT